MASPPIGIRHKNPGNIRPSSWTESQPGYIGQENNFAIFDSFVSGIAAQIRLLQAYRRLYGLTSLRGIVNRWAPPSDANDVSAYLAHVHALTGIGYDDELPDDPEVYRTVAWAMACHENGADQVGLHIGDWPFLQAVATVFPDYVSQGSVPVEAEPPSSPPPAAPPAAPPSPAPPSEEPTMVAPAVIAAVLSPFVRAAIPKLIEFAGQAAPTLIRLFGTDGSRITERNAKAVQVVVDAAMAAAGKGTVEETVSKLAADPAALQKYQAILMDDLERLMGIVARGEELDEASRDKAAARARQDSWDSMPYLVSRTERIMYIALAMQAGAMAGAFYFKVGDAYIGAIAALFVGTMTRVVEEWARPRQYRMGSSSGSKASGDAVRAIAEKGR